MAEFNIEKTENKDYILHYTWAHSKLFLLTKFTNQRKCLLGQMHRNLTVLMSIQLPKKYVKNVKDTQQLEPKTKLPLKVLSWLMPIRKSYPFD